MTIFKKYVIMEYEQIECGLSINPIELVDHSEFHDLLDCNNDYIDNSDCEETVFVLNW